VTNGNGQLPSKNGPPRAISKDACMPPHSQSPKHNGKWYCWPKRLSIVSWIYMWMELPSLTYNLPKYIWGNVFALRLDAHDLDIWRCALLRANSVYADDQIVWVFRNKCVPEFSDGYTEKIADSLSLNGTAIEICWVIALRRRSISRRQIYLGWLLSGLLGGLCFETVVGGYLYSYQMSVFSDWRFLDVILSLFQITLPPILIMVIFVVCPDSVDSWISWQNASLEFVTMYYIHM